jgi:hypothetical protein
VRADKKHRIDENERRRIRYATDPEYAKKKREAVRRYRLEHLDERRRATREWAKKHRPNKRARDREWDSAHREKRREAARLRRLNNPDKARAWRKANPDKRRDQKHRRRALTKQARTEILTGLQRKVLYATKTCYLCGRGLQSGDRTSVDHIIPLAAGGPHAFANLALVHFTCNCSKGATIPTLESLEFARLCRRS